MAFTALLWRMEGPGGWTFVSVPPDEAPLIAGPWGRSPVRATVDGQSWDTSVWKDRRHGWLLPIPKRLRAGKADGEPVEVALAPRPPA